MKIYGIAAFMVAISAPLSAEKKQGAAVSLFEDGKSLADHLRYVGVAVSEEKHHVWGSSPVKDEKGKYHLFSARYTGTFLSGWKVRSEIAHYESDTPQGPFKFVSVVIKGSGDKNAWDTGGLHNPTIKKVDGKYALFFIARGHQGGAKRENQVIGLMTASSPYGPWKREGKNGLILTPSDDANHWTHKANNGVNNPAFCKTPAGKYHLYYKSHGQTMGLAIADQLEGPYIHHPDKVTRNDKANIEDGYAFVWNKKIYLLTTDNHGILNRGGGLLWESEDGLNFKPPSAGFYPMERYIDKKDYPKGKGVYNKAWKFERPQLLLEDDQPAWLYVPSGTSIHGRDFTNCHVMQVMPKAQINQ